MKCSTCDDTGSKDKLGDNLDCDECGMADYLVLESDVFLKWRSAYRKKTGLYTPSHEDVWLEAKRQSKLEIDELKDRIKQLEDALAEHEEYNDRD